MRPTCYLKLVFILVLATLAFFQTNAQLHFEGFVFDGMSRPLLENASSVDVSPDGSHVYTTSYNDNAVSVFERDAASPSPGLVTFIETQKNQVDGVSGLGGAFSIKVSPDGNHVYVAGSIDDAIVLFDRNVVTGELTFVTKYVDGIDGIDGINGAYYIDIPGDGNHVYVTGPDDNAVAVFQRNVITGELTLIQIVEDQTGDITAMNYPLSLTVSPDGINVYVSSFGDHALTVFDRNVSTGELTYMEAHIDEQGQIIGLQGAYGVCVSSDGNHVYVAALDDSAVTVFDRTGAGELTYRNTYIDGQNGVSGISGATSVSVGPDGNYVYVNSTNDDAVAIFSRDEGTGDLMYLSMVQEGINGVNGISYPLAFVNSDDGENMYVVGFGSATLAVFGVDANTGDLDFMESESGSGMGVSGLDGSTAVALSADGKNVYAAGNNADAIVVFNRTSTDGSLEYVEKIEDGASTDGLNGINAIAVSVDGNHVYATGFWDKSLVLFERNASTGELTYIERYKDGISGVDGLNGVNYVTISADGKNVYVTGYWEHALAVFNRNEITGQLTFVEVFKDGINGVNGLNRASAVDVSPDGKNVYVAGYYDNAIAIFDRNVATGTLTYVSIIEDGINGVNGIDRVNSVMVSHDGANVYATGFNDDAIATFDRNGTDGSLTFVDELKNGVNGVVGMNGPTRLCISTDDEHIYVTSSNDDAIVAFRRNLTGGTLIFETAVMDVDDGVNGLDGAQGVAVSPDGQNMYAAGNIDDAVAVFSCTYVLENTETICEGDSVVVGSSVYHDSGIYLDTFDFGACKTILTLDLTVHMANTVVDAEICSGDSYSMGGTDYSTTGTYVADLISSASCDSTVTLHLTVVNAFDILEIDAEICQGETYTLGNQTLTTSGVYEETFTSNFGCDSTVVVTLNVKPSYDLVLDEEICGGEFYVFGTQNYINSGTYVQNFTSSLGCDSTVTLNLTVHAQFSVLDETICEFDGYELGNEIFYETGTYVVVVETSTGCETEVTLNLTVDPSPSSSFDAEICEGDSYSFEGEILTETGVYNHSYPIQNSCDSVVILNLTVHATSSILEETICDGEVYMYEGNPYSETGDWEFTYTATSGCGDSTFTLVLIVEPTTSVLNETICEGDSYTLGNNTYYDAGTYVENIITNSGCDMEVTLNLAVTENPVVDINETICFGGSYFIGTNEYTQSGTYSDIIESAMGCDSTVNLTLVVSPSMQTTESIVDNMGANTGSISVNVTGGNGPYEYLWSNGGTTAVITNLNGGDYTVIITDANGCEQEFTYTVGGIVNSSFNLDLSFELKIYPNPVSPGNMTSLEFNADSNHSINLKMYNAVGQIVKTELFEIGSGKTNKNIEAPDTPGLYLIRVQANDGSGKTFELSVQ